LPQVSIVVTTNGCKHESLLKFRQNANEYRACGLHDQTLKDHHECLQ
jgi:hypothetical protein